MQIKYSKLAIRELNKMPENITKNIISFIIKLPKGNIKALKNVNNNSRLIVGKYRIIYQQINDVFLIKNIGTRGIYTREHIKMKEIIKNQFNYSIF